MENKTVLFVKSYNGYNEGEIAGFEPLYADQLISMKVARAYVTPPAQVAQPLAAVLEGPSVDRAVNAPARRRGGKA